MNDTDGKSVASKTWLRSPSFLWLLWLVWLPFLAPPLVELFQHHPAVPPLLFSLAGPIIFLGTYLWGTWYTVQRRLLAPVFPRKDRQTLAWLSLVLLSVLSVALLRCLGRTWGGLFIFACAYACGSLPFIPAIVAVVVLALLNGVISRLGGANWLDLVSPTLIMAGVSFTVIMQVQWIKTSRYTMGKQWQQRIPQHFIRESRYFACTLRKP